MGTMICKRGIKNKLTKDKVYNYFISKKIFGFKIVKLIDDANVMTWYPLERFKVIE